MRNKAKFKFSNLYLAVILFITYLPIIVVIVYSFNNSKLAVGWSGFTLDWYVKLWNDSGLKEAVKNSIILGIASSMLSAMIGTISAVAMARRHLKRDQVVEYVSMIPIMVPEIILGMIFLSYFYLLHLPMGMLTLVIAHTTFCIPYIYMLVKSRLVGMDYSMVEAARDLGASSSRAFWDVTLPFITPAVMAGCLLSFAMSWDDVVISIFVNGPRISTLPIKIYSQIKTGVTPEINALCTIILVVTILLLIISGRFKKRHE